MAALDPISFFLWDKPRILVDIRPHKTFLKGSLENAKSIPIEEYHTFEEFLNHKFITKSNYHIQIIDLDGKTAMQLSKLKSFDFLEGGYKNFKLWRDKAFEKGPQINVLGGYTGSGKTEFLDFLIQNGFQAINLEKLACHRGSVFGKISNEIQPLHEHFQNQLLKLWLNFDVNKPVWIEEKGPFLGKAGIPESLQKRIKNATIYHLEAPFKERLKHVIKLYGDIDPLEFRAAIRRLESRMGTSKNHKALHFYNCGQIEKCFSLLIEYYDKGYDNRRSIAWDGSKIYIKHNLNDFPGTLKVLKKEARRINHGTSHSEELM